MTVLGVIIFKLPLHRKVILRQTLSGYLIPALTIVGAAIVILVENTNLPIPTEPIDISLIALLIYGASLPSLVFGEGAKRLWALPIVAMGALTYGIFTLDIPQIFIQYSGIAFISLVLATVLIIFRSVRRNPLPSELRKRYDEGLARCIANDPDFEYKSIKIGRRKINSHNALLLLIIMKATVPVLVGTFGFGGVLAAIEHNVPFSATIETLLMVMAAFAMMNKHWNLLKNPLRFLLSLGSTKDDIELKIANSFIQMFVHPRGLLYMFFIATTIIFAVNASVAFGNESYSLVFPSEELQFNELQRGLAIIFLNMGPLPFAFSALSSVLLILRIGGRNVKAPKFSWIWIAFSVFILALHRGYFDEFAWLVHFEPDRIISQSWFFGIIALSSLLHWFATAKLRKMATLRGAEEKIMIFCLAGFAILYLSNGTNIISGLTAVVLPSFLWFLAAGLLGYGELKDTRLRNLALSSGILILAILNLFEGEMTYFALSILAFSLSLLRQLGERRLQKFGKTVFRLQEYTYKSPLRYWQY